MLLGQNSERKELEAPGASSNDSSTDNHSSFCAREPSKTTTSCLLAQKSGVGIHTGRQSHVSVSSTETPGIHFRFIDEKKLSFECPAHWERLSGTTRTTALVLRGESRRKIQIAMIEHFMAAAHIWRLDHVVAVVEMNLGNADTVEFPILDGSSLDWCTSLKATTRVPQEQAVWVVTKNFTHTDGDRKIALETHEAPLTEYSFEGSFGVIAQKAAFTMDWLNPANSQLDFLKRVAPARTFGFLHEIEALRARGLALGGSLDNALVIDGEKFVNKGGQRIENELASHKMLDAIGDFALAGKPIIGKINLKGSGHALHLRTLQIAFENGCLQPGILKADGRSLVVCPQ